MYDNTEEREEYKNKCREEIENANAMKRLLNNNDFKLIFNTDTFKEDTVRLCSLFAVHDVNQELLIKQLTFYAMFNKYIDNVISIGKVAESNLEAALEVEHNESLIGE